MSAAYAFDCANLLLLKQKTTITFSTERRKRKKRRKKGYASPKAMKRQLSRFLRKKILPAA